MSCPVVVGRERELALLGAALEDAGRGRGSLVAVLGEAGVGKSRVAREVAASARAAGGMVLVGRASETSATPCRPVAEALLAATRGAGTLLTGPALAPYRPALGALVPDWRPSPEVTATEESALVRAEGFLRVLAATAQRRPSLLVLEDLHWADADTLAVVEYLADNLDGERVLCLATVRSDERTPGVDAVRRLVERRAVRAVALPRLEPDAMVVMAEAILGASAAGLTESVVARAEGLPFLLEELLAAVARSGTLVRDAGGWTVTPGAAVVPASVAETVRARLDRCPGSVRQLVALAALAAPAADAAVVASAAGLDAPEAAAAVRAAEAAQLLMPDGAALRFRHALTRDAVLAALLAPERTALSRRLAPLLPPAAAAVAARLWLQAGEPHRAARALLGAAAAAAASGALRSAAESLDEAAVHAAGDETLTADVDDLLTEVLALTGRWERVLAVGDRLLTRLAATGAPSGRVARLHLRMVRAALAGARPAVAREHVESARVLAAGAGEDDLRVAVDAADARVALEEQRLDDAERLAQEAGERAQRRGMPDVACEALEVQGRAVRLRDLHLAEAAFRRELAVAEEHGLEPWRISALHELGIIAMIDRADPTPLEPVRDLAFRAGMLTVAADIDLQVAGAHAILLHAEEAVAAGERAAHVGARLGLDLVAAVALVHAAAGHGMLGRTAAMESALAEARGLGHGHPDVEMYEHGQARAVSALLHEDRTRAEQEMAHAIEVARRNAATPPGAHRALWPLLCALRRDGAAATEARAVAAASPLTAVLLAHADAVLAGAAGRRDDAAWLVEHARELAAGRFAGMEQLGRRLVAEAAMRDGWGEPVAWLREALAHFEAAGFSRVAAACRALLREAGAPVPRPRRGGGRVPVALAGLGVTMREHEVMELVAAGMTNAEVADRLVLSVRTVEKHVESLLAKTGLRSRRALGDLAT